MKKVLFKRLLSGLLVLCMTAILLVAPTAAAGEMVPVSYGVNVLAARTDMAMMMPIGNDVAFSKDCFARALNLSEIDYVTVCTLPAVTDGELLLGSTRIAAGQSIAGENLSYMTFAPARDDIPVHSYFTFTANGGSTPIVCNLYLLDRGNCTPTVSVASSLELNVTTYRGLSAYGTLDAYDPDGDQLCFEIVSYPTNGSLKMTDQALGTYVYTPQAGYVGTDRFTYVARDQYGSYSAAATVNLTIGLSGTTVTYEDMKESPAYNAALTLTEAGIMSGIEVGGKHYFYPDRGISRVDFLVMAMNAVGIKDVPDCDKTVFFDDGEIEESMKGYIATALELGYIHGAEVDGKLCFLPNEELTCAQAAVILSDLLRIKIATVVPTFADGGEIPVWAWDAVCSLNAEGILPDDGGYIAAGAKLTRARAAQMLAASMQYCK